MKTHLEHKFLSVRRYTPLFIWPLIILLLRMREV